MTEQKKLKIGWFSFTCCEDSTIMFTEMLNDNFFEWKKIMKLRDIISHHYDIIDHEIIFDICSNHIPQLKVTVQKIIEEL